MTLWHKINGIREGYWGLLTEKLGFGSDKVKKLADYRRIIVNTRCGCVKYYVNFWGINLFPYCKHCMCVIEAKIRCEDCHCVEGRW